MLNLLEFGEKMKKLIIFSLCLFMIAALTPLLLIKFDNTSDSKIKKAVKATSVPHTQISTYDESHTNQREYIVSMAIDYIDEDYSTEAKTAILEICRNNYNYRLTKNLPNEIVNTASYSDELYKELCILYENTPYSISINGKKEYIPIMKYGGLFTATSDEYPYMCPVATPWEGKNPIYNSKKKYSCGISANSIEYLCKNNQSGKEALKYLLPEFDIT